MSSSLEFWHGLPHTWSLLKNRYIFSERNERGFDGLPLVAVSQKYGVLSKRELEAIEQRKLSTENDDLGNYKRVAPDDLVYNKMRMWQGAVGVSPIEGIVSPAYVVVAPRQNVNSRFFGYLLKSTPYVAQSGLASYGICDDQNSLRWDDFAALPSPVPPPGVQERIANFLDAQTARIDALIAEKERLLETLDEYRLSSINHAVSLGLQYSVPLVDTKDEWFSKIPAHWSFCSLNYRYEIQLGKMLDEKRITGDHLRPYLRNTDVQWGRINIESLPLMDFQPDETLRYTVRPEDLLVCEGGDVGRAAIWDGPADEIGYQKALHRVRPRGNSDLPRFLYYALFDSAKRGRFEGREKATIFHLTAEAFRRYQFAFPPLNEQRTIVAHLDALTAKLDMLKVHCEEHIARLREYRSSLISAAVTGQLSIGTLSK